MQHGLFVIYLFIQTSCTIIFQQTITYIYCIFYTCIFDCFVLLVQNKQMYVGVFYPDNISQQGHSLSETIKFSDHCRYIIYRWFTPKTLHNIILYPKCNFLIFMRKQIKHPQYQCLFVLLCSMSDSELAEFDRYIA